MLHQAINQCAVAARVVQQRQAQGHQQQPVQGHAAGRQHQALPQCRTVAPRAPAHQPAPGQRGGQRHGQRQAGCRRLETRRQPVHRRPNGHGNTGLQADMEDPDHDSAQGEEEDREPVDGRRGAALQRGQCKGGQRRDARQAQHQRAVRAVHRNAGQQRHAQAQQRHRQMVLPPGLAPAPQRPHGQRPGRPQKPQPQAGQQAHFDHRRHPPGPATADHRQASRQHRGCGQPGQQAAQGRQGAEAHQHDAAQAPGHGHGRRAAGCQRRQRQQQHRAHLPAAVGCCRQGPLQTGHGRQLRQLGRGLMAQLQQAQGGDEGQQRAIGNRPAVVHRGRLAAKGQGQRLRGVAARPVEGGVPQRHQRQHQQCRKWQAGRQRRPDPGLQRLDGRCADPVRQQGRAGGHAAQGRRQPGRAALGQGQHLAEGAQVGAAPGVAAQQAGQHIGGAQQQQRQPGQALCGLLGHQSGIEPHWRRGGHMKKGSLGCPSDTGDGAEAGASATATATATQRQAAAFLFRPRFANLLRNFSTRPPRLSTLFWVPV